jgi:guanosine-3',5'-bis(diphosphate) 3'-pyrophosphohydrolase
MIKTNKAIAFAMEAHKSQVRAVSGLPYIVHPIEVYSICKKYKESHMIDDICAAAILHDTLEDTSTLYVDLVLEFGDLVASLVAELTTNIAECALMGKLDYINKKLENMSSWALVIKLADMLANVTDNPLPKTIQRIWLHTEYLLSCGRTLSDTHRVLIDRIQYSIVTLY